MNRAWSLSSWLHHDASAHTSYLLFVKDRSCRRRHFARRPRTKHTAASPSRVAAPVDSHTESAPVLSGPPIIRQLHFQSTSDGRISKAGRRANAHYRDTAVRVNRWVTGDAGRRKARGDQGSRLVGVTSRPTKKFRVLCNSCVVVYLSHPAAAPRGQYCTACSRKFAQFA